MSEKNFKVSFKSFQWKEGKQHEGEGIVRIDVNGFPGEVVSDKDWSGKIVIRASELNKSAEALGIELDWSEVEAELQKIYAAKAAEKAEKERQKRVQEWEQRWTIEAFELIRLWEPGIEIEEVPQSLEAFLKSSGAPVLYLRKGHYERHLAKDDEGLFCLSGQQGTRRYKKLESAVKAFKDGLVEFQAQEIRENRRKSQLEMVKKAVEVMFPKEVEKSVSRESYGTIIGIVGMETDGRYSTANFHFSAEVLGEKIVWKFQGVKVSEEQLVKFYNELSAIYADNKRRN